jgi:hypothetical protein
MKKRRKKLVIILSIIAIGILTLKVYYAIENYKFEKKVEQTKSNRMEINAGKHKTLEKEDTKIHYFVSGETNQETIVFLHPAFGDHKCFDNQIEFFARNFRVITIDMLGHGLSVVEKSKDKTISTPKHIVEILECSNGCLK